MKEQKFSKMYELVCKAATVKVLGGTELKLDCTHKMIYFYMLQGYLYMSKLCNDYFESQDAISENLAIPLRTVNSKVKDLKSAGVVVVTKSTTKGMKGYSRNISVVKEIWKSGFVLKDLNGKLLTVANKPKPVLNQAVDEEDTDYPY